MRCTHLATISIPLVISVLTMPPPSLGLDGKLQLRGRKVGLESSGEEGEAGWGGDGWAGSEPIASDNIWWSSSDDVIGLQRDLARSNAL